MAYIYKNPHEQSYLAALDELAALEMEKQHAMQRLTQIDQRSAQLQAYIKAITPLMENDPGQELVDAGLTQICRDVLARNPRWMSAQEIRALLAQMGIDLSPYTNPMAVLHAVLRRIAHTCRGTDGTLYYAPYGTVLEPIEGTLVTDPNNALYGKRVR